MRIGTTDMLLGIMAITCDKLREKGLDDPGLTFGEICDGVHALQSNPSHRDRLRFIDFRNNGGGWYSEALETHFNLGNQYTNSFAGGYPQFTVGHRRAQAHTAQLRKEFGQEAITILEQMADELIKATPRYSGLAA